MDEADGCPGGQKGADGQSPGRGNEGKPLPGKIDDCRKKDQVRQMILGVSNVMSTTWIHQISAVGIGKVMNGAT